MTPDYPLIRQSETCPVCQSPKNNKQLVCWYCWRERERAMNFLAKYDYALNQTEARYQLEARR